MTTPDEQWWDAQAGEYVLGTLRGPERDVFEKILKVDLEAQAKVLSWEKTFCILDSRISEIEPPIYILPRILARIQSTTVHQLSSEHAKAQPSPSFDNTARPSDEIDSQTENNTTVAQLDNIRRRRSSRLSNTVWKGIAGFATAASLALTALLVDNSYLLTPPVTADADSVTVIQNDSNQALWIVTVNSNSNTLQTIAIAPPIINANQTHQLWIVKPDDAGVSSVGLLPRAAGTSTTLDLTSEANDATLFAVSLEPQGGSPEAVPTGPVLFTGSVVSIKALN